MLLKQAQDREMSQMTTSSSRVLSQNPWKPSQQQPAPQQQQDQNRGPPSGALSAGTGSFGGPGSSFADASGNTAGGPFAHPSHASNHQQHQQQPHNARQQYSTNVPPSPGHTPVADGAIIHMQPYPPFPTTSSSHSTPAGQGRQPLSHPPGHRALNGDQPQPSDGASASRDDRNGDVEMTEASENPPEEERAPTGKASGDARTDTARAGGDAKRMEGMAGPDGGRVVGGGGPSATSDEVMMMLMTMMQNAPILSSPEASPAASAAFAGADFSASVSGVDSSAQQRTGQPSGQQGRGNQSAFRAYGAGESSWPETSDFTARLSTPSNWLPSDLDEFLTTSPPPQLNNLNPSSQAPTQSSSFDHAQQQNESAANKEQQMYSSAMYPSTTSAYTSSIPAPAASHNSDASTLDKDSLNAGGGGAKTMTQPLPSHIPKTQQGSGGAPGAGGRIPMSTAAAEEVMRLLSGVNSDESSNRSDSDRDHTSAGSRGSGQDGASGGSSGDNQSGTQDGNDAGSSASFGSSMASSSSNRYGTGGPGGGGGGGAAAHSGQGFAPYGTHHHHHPRRGRRDSLSVFSATPPSVSDVARESSGSSGEGDHSSGAGSGSGKADAMAMGFKAAAGSKAGGQMLVPPTAPSSPSAATTAMDGEPMETEGTAGADKEDGRLASKLSHSANELGPDGRNGAAGMSDEKDQYHRTRFDSGASSSSLGVGPTAAAAAGISGLFTDSDGVYEFDFYGLGAHDPGVGGGLGLASPNRARSVGFGGGVPLAVEWLRSPVGVQAADGLSPTSRNAQSSFLFGPPPPAGSGQQRSGHPMGSMDSNFAGDIIKRQSSLEPLGMSGSQLSPQDRVQIDHHQQYFAQQNLQPENALKRAQDILHRRQQGSVLQQPQQQQQPPQRMESMMTDSNDAECVRKQLMDMHRSRLDEVDAWTVDPFVFSEEDDMVERSGAGMGQSFNGLLPPSGRARASSLSGTGVPNPLFLDVNSLQSVNRQNAGAPITSMMVSPEFSPASLGFAPTSIAPTTPSTYLPAMPVDGQRGQMQPSPLLTTAPPPQPPQAASPKSAAAAEAEQIVTLEELAKRVQESAAEVMATVHALRHNRAARLTPGASGGAAEGGASAAKSPTMTSGQDFGHGGGANKSQVEPSPMMQPATFSSQAANFRIGYEAPAAQRRSQSPCNASKQGATLVGAKQQQPAAPGGGIAVTNHYTTNPTSLSRLVPHLDDLLLALGKDTTILYASPSAVHFLGNPEDLVGKKLKDLIHPEDVTALISAIENGFKDGTGFTIYVRVKDPPSIHLTGGDGGVEGAPNFTGSPPSFVTGQEGSPRTEPGTISRRSSLSSAIGLGAAGKVEPMDTGQGGKAWPARGGRGDILELLGRPVVDVNTGTVVYMLQVGRSYHTRGQASTDHSWSMRLENARLRALLEEELRSRGVDPKTHPLLEGGSLPEGVVGTADETWEVAAAMETGERGAGAAKTVENHAFRDPQQSGQQRRRQSTGGDIRAIEQSNPPMGTLRKAPETGIQSVKEMKGPPTAMDQPQQINTQMHRPSIQTHQQQQGPQHQHQHQQQQQQPSSATSSMPSPSALSNSSSPLMQIPPSTPTGNAPTVPLAPNTNPPRVIATTSKANPQAAAGSAAKSASMSSVTLPFPPGAVKIVMPVARPSPSGSGSSKTVGSGTVGIAALSHVSSGSSTKPPRKKVKIPKEDLFCRRCGTTTSPEWRKGPEGPKTLCNACGLAHSKKQRKDSLRIQAAAQAAAVAAGSATVPPPVPVVGDPSGVANMAMRHPLPPPGLPPGGVGPAPMMPPGGPGGPGGPFPVMPPPAQHMSPAGQHMSPSGQLMSPSGQHLPPSGQHIAPAGGGMPQQSSPQMQHMVPPSGVMQRPILPHPPQPHPQWPH
ncbi:blue light receptor [Phlyctochytrium bullatum]|nr:blue light receptor [Phlyctochytrium bullatum]